MNFYWAFVLLPLADVVVGVDPSNKSESEYKELRKRYVYENIAVYCVLSALFLRDDLCQLACNCSSDTIAPSQVHTNFILSITTTSL